MAFYHTQVGGIPILIPGMHGQRSKQSIIYDKKDDIKVKSKNLYSSCKTDTAIWRKNVGTEKEQLQLERTELRMLRWLMGVSLRETRRNENIRAEAGGCANCGKGKRGTPEMVWPCDQDGGR